jgi:hypothetical protein
MLDIAHCLRCIWYSRRFGSWLYSCLQVIGCRYTDRFITFFLIIHQKVEVEPTPKTLSISSFYLRQWTVFKHSIPIILHWCLKVMANALWQVSSLLMSSLVLGLLSLSLQTGWPDSDDSGSNESTSGLTPWLLDDDDDDDDDNSYYITNSRITFLRPN